MMVTDFTRPGDLWRGINDGVMGGVSTGAMTLENGHAAFRGRVSFDNNGGFASIRSRPAPHDLGGFDGLLIRVRGDGKRYGLRLRTADTFDGVSYQASLAPPVGEWREIRLPFSEFRPVFRGRVVPGQPPLDPARIRTLGVIIARQEGPFMLEIAWIQAYPPAP